MSMSATPRRMPGKDVKSVFNKVFEEGVEAINKVDVNKFAELIYDSDAVKSTSLRGVWMTPEGKQIAEQMAQAWTDQEKLEVSRAYKNGYAMVSDIEKNGVGKTLERVHLGARLLHDIKAIS